jgi:transposase
MAATAKTTAIPPTTDRQISRDHDRDLCKARHLIENFGLPSSKQFRATAALYDKTALNFLAAVQLATAGTWLNRGHALAEDHCWQSAYPAT